MPRGRFGKHSLPQSVNTFSQRLLLSIVSEFRKEARQLAQAAGFKGKGNISRFFQAYPDTAFELKQKWSVSWMFDGIDGTNKLLHEYDIRAQQGTLRRFIKPPRRNGQGSKEEQELLMTRQWMADHPEEVAEIAMKNGLSLKGEPG